MKNANGAPTEDMHVHSTFSDGLGDLAANIRAAERAGLTRLGCVDHVRASTTWLPEFVAAVTAAQRSTQIELRVGIEAKLLDQSGTLDVPMERLGVDRIYAADHQVPLGNSCVSPRVVRSALASGELQGATVIAAVIDAVLGAATRYPNVVIAHLFSVLPKCGLDEAAVSDAELARLVAGLARAGAEVEIDEQWACPNIRTAAALHAAGVRVLASSDAHKPEAIGVYDHVRNVFAALAA